MRMRRALSQYNPAVDRMVGTPYTTPSPLVNWYKALCFLKQRVKQRALVKDEKIHTGRLQIIRGTFSCNLMAIGA
jgi:hypothetical protein